MTTEYRDNIEDDSSSFWNRDTTKEVQRLKFAVENNRDQLSSVSEALKQLSVLDTISKTVVTLKCSFEHFVNNGSISDGCCPLGWESSRSSCYFFSKISLSWHDARDWCNGHESHLVILINDDDWDYVIAHTHGTFYWVGLTDEKTGQWEWVNQTPYTMNRRRWKPGQPDSWTNHGLGPGDEDCAHMHHDGRLNDLHCSTRMRFICQRHSQHS
ncbi:C-type lectin domain family 10 member A [Xenentodon cancila]